MRAGQSVQPRLKGWLLCLCLSLLLHGAWIGVQSGVNILEHMAGGEIEYMAVEETHLHADHNPFKIAIPVDDDQRPGLHHHHHVSETSPSVLPATGTTEPSIWLTSARYFPGNSLTPDGIRPSGPFQPPRT